MRQLLVPLILNIMTEQSQPDETQTRIVKLIADARSGDQEALGELLDSYRKFVKFLARSGLHHHLQGKADPSDLAQEVCIAAHGNMADFRGQTPEEFAGWLRGILSNVLAMHLRKYLGTQKRDPRLEQNLNASLVNASGFLQSKIAADVTSPSQHFARNEAFLQLAEALESLPEHYREVIVLRHVEGMSFADVAKSMDKSVDSVEKLWVRGLAKLRTIMT
ncbi:RNA-polymerase sigma-E factor [Rhodopirellula europaea SH398]|jgi:RNA polymerase sigma-70 factor (ECF subfamily)|uniref:RNA-polymerase sigma-E factor n=2 Tax=Pirellulaceae TaxID=2691357 RepID=M5SC14_9BACT|nr:RNA-polymerase sigma-E factor [Rhodopirellula europaea SH398]|tara:strand:+ start:10862 stop:11521 length:660 start_codon:yes stop_codon:yes gene_type:complete